MSGRIWRWGVAAVVVLALGAALRADPSTEAWSKLAPHFTPPPEFAGKLGGYRSLLIFNDGTPVRTREDWQRRRREILDHWHGVMGAWPPVIEKPAMEYLGKSRRESFTQHKVRVETARGQMTAGYLLVPDGDGPFPAVFVPFYEPETSTGQNDKKLRD